MTGWLVLDISIPFIDNLDLDNVAKTCHYFRTRIEEELKERANALRTNKLYKFNNTLGTSKLYKFKVVPP